MKNSIATLIFTLTHLISTAQCTGNEPILFLGNDTSLCPGASITLQAVNGYDNYTWSNNSTTQTLNVTTAGTYFIEATITSGGTNLVINGDFENGSTGFTSDYIPGTGGAWGLLSNPSQYAVSSSPNLVHNNFYSCGDHTTGTGNMYIANGSDIPNTIVWEQNVTVVPNTNYNFSAWATSVENTTDPAFLQFFVNNIQIGAVFSPTNTGCNWTEFFNVWNSGAATSATISIKNQNISQGGNDFALDDISFQSYCTNYDTIVVSYDPTTLDIGPNISFCDYAPQTISATSNDPTLQYSWNTSETTSTITPTTTGQYILTATTDSGCLIQDSTVVTVNITPTNINVSSTDESCDLNNGQITLGTVTNGNAPYQYNLNSAGYSTTTNYSNLNEGTYTLSVQDANGCIYDANNIILNNTPGPNDINITTTDATCQLTNGAILINNTVGGQSPMNYSIDGINYTNTINYSNIPSGTYTVYVQDANSCSYSENVIINNSSSPIANFNCAAFIVEGGEVALTNQSSSDVISYDWSIPNGNPSTSTSENPTTTFTELQPGYYPITLIVTNQDNCTDSITKYIEYKSDPLIFVPNCFTPDGDSHNNNWEFYLNGFDEEKFNVKIFDRWGEMVWESNDPTQPWDGKYNNKLVQSGSYSWIITAYYPTNDDVVQYVGHLKVLY